MSVQDGIPSPAAAPQSHPSSPVPPAGVQRIMPVLYVNQSAVKSVATATSSPAISSATPTSSIIQAVPQIQLAGGGSPQIIHSATSSSAAYSYVPVRQMFQQAKGIKDTTGVPKKVFVTSGPNNKPNQVHLFIPNNQNTNPTNKCTASLILPNLGTLSNKGTITEMLLPNNVTAGNVNKPVTSLLLPSTTKYPNIAPNKKVPIPNIPQQIIIPQQNISSKPVSVPNIIRQSPAPGGKNVVGIFSTSTANTSTQMTSLLLAPNTHPSIKTPTSMGLIIPTSGSSHGLIVSQATAGQTHSIIVPQSSCSSGQSHSIIVPQSTCTSGQSHSIIVPQSSGTGGQSQLTNLILNTSAPSNLNIPTTPVASLLISNNTSTNTNTVGSGHMTSLLFPPASTAAPATAATASILVPVSVGPNNKPTSREMQNKQSHSVLVKSGGSAEKNFPLLPPLQPISSKDAIGRSLLTKPLNGFNVPESLIMTPVPHHDDSHKSFQNKSEWLSHDMVIERTSSDKGTSTIYGGKTDDKFYRTDEISKQDIGFSMSAIPTRDEGLVLDGEVTVRRLGPVKEETQMKKDMDDDVKIELVKPKLPPPRYQKPEDLNPMEVLEWDHQGVGKLPGSNIKFRINEYGLDLVVDNKEASSSNTPQSSRRNSDEKTSIQAKDTQDTPAAVEETDKIYCCEGCGCYGLYTEFLMDTRFCSVGCKKIVVAREEMKKKRQDDKMREMRLRRKRRKIKILAQRARRGGLAGKDSKENKNEPLEDEDCVGNNNSWSNKVADFRKKRTQKLSDLENSGSVQDEDSRGVTPLSGSEASENASQSSIRSEDDASSDRTAPNLGHETKENSIVNSAGEFVWSYYLHKVCHKAKAAPVKLFRDPFPYGKNSFKVGMKLEGIDPEHQAIISVLTVVQVKGHRIRLHFDGFPDQHDFWTNSDSADIFPPGWCERNGHTLDPPRGYTAEIFNWNTYLKQCRASPAPKALFPKSAHAPLCPSQFRVGMKLEAVDRKNSSLICVATVTNIIDTRLLIHFDSWGDVYDYWADPTSPYIHPVGWCEANGHDLTPPNTFKNPASFSWEVYLKETKAVVAPARAFKPRSPHAFRRGMKLEAIDRRAPTHLRPTTIREIKEYQLKICFDGYPDEFGYWVDDDCPDIHPVGWGHKTGHTVTPPPLTAVKSDCGTVGCSGDGNIKGGFLTKHDLAVNCPYSPQNLNRDCVRDRFCINPGFFEVPEPINKSKSGKPDAAEDSSCSESKMKTRLSSSLQKDDSKEECKIKSEPEEKPEERIERRGRKRKLPEPEIRMEQLDKLRKELIQTVLDPGYKPSPGEQEMWVKHVATLGHKVSVTGGDPRQWNHKQVAAFVNTVIPSRAKLFLDQEIDGESFLMLTQADLTKVLGLKLGPALKIYNCIILLRQKVMSL